MANDTARTYCWFLPQKALMVESGMTALRRRSEETDVVMSDCDWLTQVFKQAEREYHDLPEWARPVLTPPMAAAANDAADTEVSAEGRTLPGE
jgi:hypothetical protein